MKKRLCIFMLIMGMAFALLGCELDFELTLPEERSKEPVMVAATGEDVLEVIFLDVGQGASQLIKTPNGKVILIDGGDLSKQEKMLQYLEEYEIKLIDLMIATHPHADHIGGLIPIVEQYEVEQIFMPKAMATTKTFENFLLAIQDKGLGISTAKAGLILDLDPSLKIQFVGPVDTYKNLNDMSAVVKIIYGDVSFLLTGDAEQISETDMLQSGINLSATILGVGHHGSNTSTSEAFLRRVSPEMAVIQSGEGNSYGHPHQEILHRLIQANVEIYRNDFQGTIHFLTDGDEINVVTTKGGEDE